jgi:hypothetical protein
VDAGPEAIRDFDIAIAGSAPDAIAPQLYRALALARDGRHAEACASADALEVRRDLACVYAAATAAARGDATIPESDRRALATRYQDRAFAQLERVRATGVFNRPEISQAVASDPDLRPIREDPRFRALLRPSESRPKPRP